MWLCQSLPEGRLREPLSRGIAASPHRQAESRQGGFPLATPASVAGWNFGEDLSGAFAAGAEESWEILRSDVIR